MSQIRRPATTDLYLYLSEAQAAERAAKAIEMMAALAVAEEKFAAIKKQHQAEIKKAKADLKAVAQASHTKREMANNVACTQVFDPTTMRTWYEYNDEVYNERECTTSELQHANQRVLFDEKHGATAAPKDDEGLGLEGSEGDDDDADADGADDGDELHTADLVNPPGGPTTVEDLAGGLAAVAGA